MWNGMAKFRQSYYANHFHILPKFIVYIDILQEKEDFSSTFSPNNFFLKFSQCRCLGSRRLPALLLAATRPLASSRLPAAGHRPPAVCSPSASQPSLPRWIEEGRGRLPLSAIVSPPTVARPLYGRRPPAARRRLGGLRRGEIACPPPAVAWVD
jgi:hypothetical protein